VNIEFTLVDVESFALIQAWNCEISVIFHMDIHLHDGRVYFVESTSETGCEDLIFEDYINSPSSVFLVAREAYYSILPYETRAF
jgi:hypothetical protein